MLPGKRLPGSTLDWNYNNMHKNILFTTTTPKGDEISVLAVSVSSLNQNGRLVLHPMGYVISRSRRRYHNSGKFMVTSEVYQDHQFHCKTRANGEIYTDLDEARETAAWLALGNSVQN